MGIRFEDSAPKAKTVEDIIVCGKKMGDMKINPPTEYCPRVTYHAGIHLEGLSNSDGFIQGHGDTREAAVAQAVERGILHAKTLLTSIDDFQQKLAINEEGKPDAE